MLVMWKEALGILVMWKEADNVTLVQTLEDATGQWVLLRFKNGCIMTLVEVYSTDICYKPNALETSAFLFH